MHFTKMHGIGNDYIYIDCFKEKVEDPAYLAKIMSPRRTSVGSDGVILICPSDTADAKMRMFNLDGSEGKMCGNGIRCLGKYIYDNGIARKKTLTVETLSGIKTLYVTEENGKAVSLTVDMGEPILTPRLIPVKFSGDKMINEPVNISGTEYRITAVSMGNPHAVVFCDDIKGLNLEKTGPLFESNPIFPEQVNTEFIRVKDSKNLEMRVWERGSGETFACGTGACAAAAAAVLNGYCKRTEEIAVHLKCGVLTIKYAEDGHIYMRGAAEKVYEGVYCYES
ncbi:MAG TPA: diaminopimelate epimerase [Ruminococcaceae bacterium]|nr:diaminopimelate epimerase [Oscillospiraceae bacterium]